MLKFPKNEHFTFWRFLSRRHEISKNKKSSVWLIYLTTRMPNIRPIGCRWLELWQVNRLWFNVTEYRESGNFEVQKVWLPIFRKFLYFTQQSFGWCLLILWAKIRYLRYFDFWLANSYLISPKLIFSKMKDLTFRNPYCMWKTHRTHQGQWKWVVFHYWSSEFQKSSHFAPSPHFTPFFRPP